MNDALYFPVHRAKAGEIAGVGHLSPRTRTRVRPAFEVQKQREDDDTPLDEHLSGVAHQLLAAWGSRYPLFADFSQFGPEDRTADGKHCAEYFFRCLRQQSMLGIPMTGPESVRGPGYGYIDAVARIASEDERLEPASVDLFLDFEMLALLPADSRLEQDVGGPVRPPVRVRLSTGREHVFWRAPRKDYIQLSEKVVASRDFDPELAAWGSGMLRLCARCGRGKGGPAEWVARDTNLHIEVTVRAVESFLRRAGRLSGVSFAEPESFPWDQALIDTQPASN